MNYQETHTQEGSGDGRTNHVLSANPRAGFLRPHPRNYNFLSKPATHHQPQQWSSAYGSPASARSILPSTTLSLRMHGTPPLNALLPLSKITHTLRSDAFPPNPRHPKPIHTSRNYEQYTNERNEMNFQKQKGKERRKKS